MSAVRRSNAHSSAAAFKKPSACPNIEDLDVSDIVVSFKPCSSSGSDYKAINIKKAGGGLAYSLGKCNFRFAETKKKPGSWSIQAFTNDRDKIDAMDRLYLAVCKAVHANKDLMTQFKIGNDRNRKTMTPEKMMEDALIKSPYFVLKDKKTGEPVESGDVSIFIGFFDKHTPSPTEFVVISGRQADGKNIYTPVDWRKLKGKRLTGIIQCSSGRVTDSGSNAYKYACSRIVITDLGIQTRIAPEDDENVVELANSMTEEEMQANAAAIADLSIEPVESDTPKISLAISDEPSVVEYSDDLDDEDAPLEDEDAPLEDEDDYDE